MILNRTKLMWLLWLAIGIGLGAGGVFWREKLQPRPLTTATAPPLSETNGVMVFTLEPMVAVHFDPSFTAMIRRWQNKDIPSDHLAELVSTEFARQEVFQYLERDRTRIGAPINPSLGLRSDHWQSKRDDAIQAILGADAFHHWNQPRLFGLLDLSHTALSEIESNQLYLICQARHHAMQEFRAFPPAHPSQVTFSWHSPRQKWNARYGHQHRQMLVNLLGEDRYYHFAADNESEEEYGDHSHDISYSHEQRLRIYRQREKEMEEIAERQLGQILNQYDITNGFAQAGFTNVTLAASTNSSDWATAAALEHLTPDQRAKLHTAPPSAPKPPR